MLHVATVGSTERQYIASPAQNIPRRPRVNMQICAITLIIEQLPQDAEVLKTVMDHGRYVKRILLFF